MKRFAFNQTGSIAIEFAIVIPIMVLILFGCIDLLRFFQLTTLLDSRSEYLANYFSEHQGQVADNFGSLVEQLQLSADFDLMNLSGAAYVIRLQPDGGSVSLNHEMSDVISTDCSSSPAVPDFRNSNDTAFFPSQIFVQVFLCLKLEDGFFLNPVIRNLKPVVIARATRAMTDLSLGAALE